MTSDFMLGYCRYCGAKMKTAKHRSTETHIWKTIRCYNLGCGKDGYRTVKPRDGSAPEASEFNPPPLPERVRAVKEARMLRRLGLE